MTERKGVITMNGPSLSEIEAEQGKFLDAMKVVEELAGKLNESEMDEYNAYGLAGAISIGLVKYRIAHGMSESELSEILGIDAERLAEYESGDFDMSIFELARIANRLGWKLNIEC